MTDKTEDTPVQKQFSAETKAVGDRQIRVVVSTENVDRDRDVIRAAGIDLSNFKASPTVLFNHNPNYPIARATSIAVEGQKVVSVVQFPPEGASEKADEIYNLVRAGILNSASIGFIPQDWEPMRGPEGQMIGRDYKAVELLEFSIVSVASNRQSLIIERQFRKEAGLPEEEAEPNDGTVPGQAKGEGDQPSTEGKPARTPEEIARAKGRMPTTRARLNLTKLKGQHPAQ